MTNVRLLRDQCLIRLEKPERLSASKRLFIPSDAKRQPHELYEAIVLATGPGIRRKDGNVRPVEAKPGDRVLCYWAAFDFEALPEWNDCRIIREGMIQAVLQ